MQRSTWHIAAIGLLTIALISTALAQSGPGSRHRRGGNGTCKSEDSRMSRARNYDPASAGTVRGEVIEVTRVDGRQRSGGIHLLVKSDAETVPVHLGPGWYLDDLEVEFKVGDAVEVHGSRVDEKGERALIADKVTRDGKELQLRRADGTPRWSRGPRGR